MNTANSLGLMRSLTINLEGTFSCQHLKEEGFKNQREIWDPLSKAFVYYYYIYTVCLADCLMIRIKSSSLWRSSDICFHHLVLFVSHILLLFRITIWIALNNRQDLSIWSSLKPVSTCHFTIWTIRPGIKLANFRLLNHSSDLWTTYCPVATHLKQLKIM